MSEMFRYYLVNGLGQSYKLSPDHVVTLSSLPVKQRYTPDGWQDKAVRWGRNIRWPGVMRSFTTPFRFVKDGAYILRYIYYGTKGIQSECYLLIQIQDPRTGVYEEWYTGALDFSQKNDQRDYFEVNVMESGLPEFLNANDDTVYEIPVDVPDALEVKADGTILKANASYVIQEGESTGNFTLLGCLFTNSEGTFRDILFNTQNNFIADNINVPPVSPDSTDYLIRNDGPAQIFNFHFKYQVKRPDTPGLYTIYFDISNGSSFVIETIPFTQNIGVGELLDIDLELPVTLQQGERLFVSVGNAGVAGHYVYSPGGTLDITFDYRFRETTVKCLRGSYVFNELVKKITNGKYQGASTLLNNEAFDFVLTCVDAIRGLPGAKIKTSLNDFVDSYNVPFCVGLGIEGGKAILEKENYYFRNTVIASLGEVANLRSKPATDRLFNAVKIGWPNPDINDVNGRYEFNTTHFYTTSITKVQKTLEKVSVYRSDCYGFESLRINLTGKTTTDSESDNDVFMLNIVSDGTGGYILNRPAFTSITGVPTDTVFNVLLAPAFCLRAHGYSLRCGLDKQESEYLVFQTADKNSDLSTTLNGITVKQNANVMVGSLEAPLSYPEELEFDCEVPGNIKQIMEADPYGLIEILSDGKPFYGHIMDASQQPAMNPAQTFKTLASTATDMTQLIR